MDNNTSELKIVSQLDAQRAANAMLVILNYPQGAVPNSVRPDIPGLEALVNGILTGKLVVVLADSIPRKPPAPDE